MWSWTEISCTFMTKAGPLIYVSAIFHLIPDALQHCTKGKRMNYRVLRYIQRDVHVSLLNFSHLPKYLFH